jgi:hypothetical protein
MGEQGSCGQLMNNAPGSPAEKEAVYKQMKIELQSSWLKSQSSENLEKVVAGVSRITHKLAAEKKLCEISVDSIASEKALVECQELLHQSGKHDAAEALKFGKDENQFAHYAVLRKAATILSTIWLTEAPEAQTTSIEKELVNNPIINLALAKYDSRQLMLANFDENVKRKEKEGDFAGWTSQYWVLMTQSNFYEKAVSDLIRKLQQEEHQGADAVLSSFASTTPPPPTQKDVISKLVGHWKAEFPSETAKALIDRFCNSLERANLNHLVAVAKQAESDPQVVTMKQFD